MTLDLQITAQSKRAHKTRLAVIDTDIHNFDVYDDPVFNQIFTDYLAPEWREYHKNVSGCGDITAAATRAPNRMLPAPTLGRRAGVLLELTWISCASNCWMPGIWTTAF